MMMMITHKQVTYSQTADLNLWAGCIVQYEGHIDANTNKHPIVKSKRQACYKCDCQWNKVQP